jgi:NAD(P)-dependent dehydrogenase (short-subunit alcohol dehydrogenase family)
MSYWQGKRALIIGGSAGLGRAIADVLAQYGARLAIVGRRQSQLDLATKELKACGADVIDISADVTNPEHVDRLFATIKGEWGGIEFLCHCAGRSMRGTMLGTSPDDFRDLWETNFLSAVRCIQQFSAPLIGSRGHVVLIGSLASKVATGYLGAYPASKFPLAALAQQMRMEMGERGLHTLLVCPGPIARDDELVAGARYISESPDVPITAHLPGGGAKMRPINPHWLAGKILRACEDRRAELVVPKRARLLCAVAQLSPRLGDWFLRRLTSG